MPGAQPVGDLQQVLPDQIKPPAPLAIGEPVKQRFEFKVLDAVTGKDGLHFAETVMRCHGLEVGMFQPHSLVAGAGSSFNPGAKIERTVIVINKGCDLAGEGPVTRDQFNLIHHFDLQSASPENVQVRSQPADTGSHP